MTNPSPACVSHPHLAQRTQSAAAEQKDHAAAPSTPPGLLPIGRALAAIIAGLPVPADLERQ